MDIASMINSASPGVMFVVSAQDLKDFGSRLVKECLMTVISELRNETYDASEVMKLCHIKRSTLANWQKEGILKVVGKAGNKNMYSKKEVDAIVEKNIHKDDADVFVMKLRAERKRRLEGIRI